MKKTSLLFNILFLSMIQANPSGYIIFDYENTMGHDFFDIKRAYIDYSTDISEDLFLKIKLDVGRDVDVVEQVANAINQPLEVNTEQKLSAYIKNAYVDWKCADGSKLSVGLITTNSYGVQEKNWGYRFIDKSVLDKYGMSNTADFGMGYSREIKDFNLGIQLLNGEGFKKEENSDQYQQSLYISLLYGEEKLNKNDGYNAGLVINYNTDGQDNGEYELDMNSDGVNDHYQDQNGANPTARFYDSKLVGIFGGWSKDKLRVGAEYNQLTKGTRATFIDLTQTGNPIHNKKTFEEISYAVYANYSIAEDKDVFIRYDINDQNSDNADFNIDGVINKDDFRKDKQFLIGAVWNPAKNIYISPNVNFKDENQRRSQNTYKLSFMFKY